MQQALDPADVDSALDNLPEWRHAGEFLVRVVPVGVDEREMIQERVAQVETDPERCSFTDTDAGMMIYLGDQAGEGISEHDLQTAAKIDSILARV